MSIGLTEEQKRENIINNIDKNMFVEAGAGAGKTTLIIKRIINQIRAGIKPEQIVVITFTNKAAGELLERIETALEKEESNPNNTQKERGLFQDALEHISLMTISTIHSFAFQLLKERCFDAKLPLNAILLEDEQALVRKKQFFAEWLAKLEKDKVSEIKEAVYFYTEKWYYKEWLEEAFLKICEKPSDIHIVCLQDSELIELKNTIIRFENEKNAKIKAIEDDMKNYLKELNRIAEEVTGQKLNTELCNKNLFKVLSNSVTETSLENSGKTYINIYKGQSICKQSNLKKQELEWAKTINSNCKEWVEQKLLNNQKKTNYDIYCEFYNEEKKKEIKKKKETYLYYVLMKYAVLAREEYQKSLNGETISNDELLQRTKNLVDNSEEAVTYFAEKYRYIYVDEFQDTDHVQASFIWKIACGGNNTLREGSLFVVGDPKQAIYRFRGGELSVYDDIKKKMSDPIQQAEVYELDNNYRSNSEIIDWVNTKFQSQFLDNEMNYRDMQALEISEEKGEAKTILKGVYKIPLNLPVESKVEENVKLEAEALAEWIQKLVQKDYKIYEKVEEKDGAFTRKLRNITYRDFLILCWKKTYMKIYLEEMQKLGIPVELSGSIEVAKNYALQSFVHLYCYLKTPYDKKLKEMARHLLSQKETLDNEIVELRLEQLRKDTKEMNSQALAFYLMEQIEYLLPLEEEISKVQMHSVQLKLRQMVEYVLANTANPADLSKAFSNYLQKIIEHELPLEENQNAVRFMNLHKAKGLEAVITIVINRVKRPSYESEYKAKEKNAEGLYDFYEILEKKNQKPYPNIYINGYAWNDETEKCRKIATEEEDQEQIRLEYVAATRAKEVLLVMEALDVENVPFENYEITGNLEEKNTSEAENENTSKEEVFEIPVVIKKRMEKKTEDLTESNVEYVVDESEVSAADLQLQEDFGIEKKEEKAEKEENIEHKAYVSLSPSMLEDRNKKKNSSTAERRPKGNIFGKTMHRSFELLVKKYKENRSFEPSAIEECIGQAMIEHLEDLLSEGPKKYLKKGEKPEDYLIAVREYLQKILTDFVKSKEINEILESAEEIYTELPFSYFVTRETDVELFKDIEEHLEKHKIAINKNQPVWINGTADLVVRTEKEIIVIDYKSDIKTENTRKEFEERLLNEEYKGQLQLYAYAMKRIFQNDNSVRVCIYHLYDE